MDSTESDESDAMEAGICEDEALLEDMVVEPGTTVEEPIAVEDGEALVLDGDADVDVDVDVDVVDVVDVVVSDKTLVDVEVGSVEEFIEG